MASDQTPTTETGKAASKTDSGLDRQRKAAERAEARDNEQGYRGYTPDETPNHAYTVAGVTAGEPTPENGHEAKGDTA